MKAARARIFARLGHRAAAGFLWGQVAAAADAPPETLRAAALYLVGWGDPREARRAVARLKALAPYREEGARLEEALAARLELEQVVEPS